MNCYFEEEGGTYTESGRFQTLKFGCRLLNVNWYTTVVNSVGRISVSTPRSVAPTVSVEWSNP